ncbi:RagB/SusD family nutrient uptake outer membrane protein [Parapedobacter sp. ISTM3]|uniref:RagB/SusD family nutrient uptake outer membrane protein n=1 Tax=Parapedobacter sp. ISTM3 TaxID=2800130 RepID=UPI00190708CE|nr:RagB/SusD family nutrient uptake outer membrane protein [Parapedobacter sp. ISTM3]MBK1441946.1 RagB/SusD family nutrient uptake outer membrane protein [Parapedobacter sp. ISTM3]
MKKLKNNIICLTLVGVFTACSGDFLERVPQGELITAQLENPEGVEATLVGAYALLNGNVNGTWGNYASAPSQWLFGEVAADNAHKGSNNGDQPNMNQIESHQAISTNDNLAVMWSRCYEGIARCNNTLRLLNAVQAGSGERLSDSRATEITAEARMLRAHYYFFLKRVFRNVPYVDENTATADAVTIPNNTDVYPQIEADLRFAVDNLPPDKPLGEIGRVDRIAAQAYLGKVLLYLGRHSEALPLFEAVMDARPDITTLPFTDNFDVTRENGPESIFAVQHAINPDGSGDNANVGDMLGGFYGNAPVNCCGFFQPTFDLVNAFRVNAAGLPMLDGSYRTNAYTSDFGLTGNAKTNYAVDRTIAFDPRLDYTVGRRGVPFRDWGIMPGDSWIRDPAYAGPFVGAKHMIEQSQFSTHAVQGTLQITGLNVNLIRLADVYLMAAECQVEAGNLGEALALVNAIRERAAQLPGKQVNGAPAAAYNVQPYPSFPNADYARDAIRFERRLELALEGHRFFDLVRWGIAKEVLESYSAFEGQLLSAYRGLVFQPRNEYFPIPQEQIDRSQGALVQHDEY